MAGGARMGGYRDRYNIAGDGIAGNYAAETNADQQSAVYMVPQADAEHVRYGKRSAQFLLNYLVLLWHLGWQWF